MTPQPPKTSPAEPPPPPTPEPPPPHVHAWQPVGIVAEEEIGNSPVSRMDDLVRTNQIAVQSCSCGATSRKVVSYGQIRWLNRRNA